MTLALSRMKWGKPRQSIPSRFLFELTGQADNPLARSDPHRTKTASPNTGPRRQASGVRGNTT
jgi:DNA helicase II / ATP-dependent DNA helicase PcrA